jgi:hypothetical protein
MGFVIGRRGVLAGGTGLGLVGCAAPPPVQVTAEQPAPYGQPDMVLVHNFAVRPEDVQLDPGLKARIAAAFEPDAYSSQQLDVAQDYPGAVQTVRTLMFVDKFGQDVMARQHALDA